MTYSPLSPIRRTFLAWQVHTVVSSFIPGTCTRIPCRGTDPIRMQKFCVSDDVATAILRVVSCGLARTRVGHTKYGILLLHSFQCFSNAQATPFVQPILRPLSMHQTNPNHKCFRCCRTLMSIHEYFKMQKRTMCKVHFEISKPSCFYVVFVCNTRFRHNFTFRAV